VDIKTKERIYPKFDIKDISSSFQCISKLRKDYTQSMKSNTLDQTKYDIKIKD